MPLPLKSRAQLYYQLHAGLKAGLPLEALLAGTVLPGAPQQAAQRIGRAVQQGKPLSVALQGSKLVAGWEVRLLAIGEDSGRLESILADLALFFDTRAAQFARLRSKLVFPFLLLLAAILLQPLPRVAAGNLGGGAYLGGVLLQVLVVYALYKFFIARAFAGASDSAFNPLLLRVLRRLGDGHWLRQVFEISYLNLMTLCLEGGMDAAQTLRLLRDGSQEPDHRRRHELALKQVEGFGLSLSQALGSAGIIRHPQIHGFLLTSEQSGTLHSALREFILRKRVELAGIIDHFLNRLGHWLYLLVVALVVSRIL